MERTRKDIRKKANSTFFYVVFALVVEVLAFVVLVRIVILVLLVLVLVFSVVPRLVLLVCSVPSLS